MVNLTFFLLSRHVCKQIIVVAGTHLEVFLADLLIDSIFLSATVSYLVGLSRDYGKLKIRQYS